MVIETKESTDVESTNRVRASVCTLTLNVSYDPISVECLFSIDRRWFDGPSPEVRGSRSVKLMSPECKS